MPTTGCIARPATEADHPAFLALLERGWPDSTGYHVSILNRWKNEWPQILEGFEALLVVEAPTGLVGYAGLKREDAPYSFKSQVCVDHFLVPERPVETAIAQLAEAVVAWARTRDFVRVRFILEPGEATEAEALLGVGCFPELIAHVGYGFPHPPAHPAIRPMRPDEYPQVLELGARLAEHITSYAGALPQLGHQDLVAWADRTYRELGAERPHTFLVAEHEGKVAGFLFAVFQPPNGGFIYEVYVAPEARRQGLYRALSYQGSEWLYQQGARYLVEYVHVENEIPLRFLADWGFKPYFITWDRNL